MKSKIKRHSRSVLSVVLALCMLISCMTVGLIATDAAKVTGEKVGAVADSDSVGATTWKVHRDDGMDYNMTSLGSNNYSVDVSISSIGNFVFNVTDGTTWYGNDTTILDSTKLNSSGGYTMSTSKGNMTLYVSAAGTFNFLWNSSDKKLNVTRKPSNDVLSGSKIMIYGGQPNNWTAKYGLYSSGTTVTEAYTVSIDSDKYTVLEATAGTYTYAYSSSDHTATIQPGYIYKANDWSSTAPTNTLSTSITTVSPVQPGTALVISSSGSNGKTAGKFDLYPLYYVHKKDTSTYTEVTVSSNSIDTTGYVDGNYELITVLTDGALSLVADRDDFTITSSYDVTVATGLDHGTLSATSENDGGLTGLTGTHTITVTAEPTSGYEVVWPSGYTSPVDGDSNKATVEVSGATTITAQFLKPKQAITVIGGTANPNPARPGETVTLAPTVPEGKVLTGVSATDENGDPVEIDSDYYTFTMPDTPVTAEFTYRDRNRVKVTIPTVANGKIVVQSGTLTDGYAYEGDVLVFAGSPDSGYKLDTGSWTITEAGGSPASQTTGETLSVVVGDKNFTVSAAFIVNPEYEVNVTVNNDDAGGVDSINYELAPAGTEIVINYSCELDYDVLNDSDITITGDATNVTKDRTNKTITFTMPANDVTVNIDFTYTVTQSTRWFYNAYNKNNQGHPRTNLSDWQGLTMNEATINGQRYAYIKISGRPDDATEQMFTIIDGSKSEGSSGTRYVYFTNNNQWYNLKAYFMGANQTWPGVSGTYVSGSGSETIYKFVIPSGATGVVFNGNEGSDSGYPAKTADITGTDFATGISYYMGGWSSNNGSQNIYNYNTYNDSRSDAGPSNSGTVTGTEYLYDNKKVTNAQAGTTNGTISSYSNSVPVYQNNPRFGSNLYTPYNNFSFKEDDSTNDKAPRVGITSGMEYYVIVYFPNTNYHTINGQTADNSGNNYPVVVCSATRPGEQAAPITKVNVFAKDGTVRVQGAPRNPGSDQDYSTFEKHADTNLMNEDYSAVEDAFGHGRTRSGGSRDTFDYAGGVPIGTTLHIQTTVDSTLNATHDLIGYCINGTVYDMLGDDRFSAPTTSGTDTLYRYDFTIPDDWKDGYVEITPIYKAKSGTMIRFYVQGYDDDVKNSGWGNTLGVFPYYQGLSRANNAYGGYPGQPMVFYKGAYYADIPETYSGKTIKGITLSNMYWDDIHLSTGEVSRHHQTYDYDDLYKIFIEYPNPEGKTRNIICSFKYETNKNNDEPSSLSTPANYNDTNGNGWEVLTNYAGTPVDIYGNELDLTAAQAESQANVRVISQDYRSNCAGHYATEWAVYDGSTKKGVIVPSALVLKKENMLSGSGSTPTVEQARSYMTDTYGKDTAKYASAYVAMDNLRNKPVLITYEQSIWGGNDQAERCDARWYWSYTGDPVKANVKVQYSNDLGATYTDDGSAGVSVTGTYGGTASVSGGTGNVSDGYLIGKIGDDGFDLTASEKGTNTDYEFVGWYAEREGKVQELASTSATPWIISDIPVDSNVTFIARYMYAPSGSFSVSHEIHNLSKGYGDVYISAVVNDKDGNTIKTYSENAQGNAAAITISGNGSDGNQLIRAGSGNTIEVTLRTSPYNHSVLEDFYATYSDLLNDTYRRKTNYVKSVSVDKTNNTATVVLDVNKFFIAQGYQDTKQVVTSETYYSKLGLGKVSGISLTYTFETLPRTTNGTKTWKLTNYTLTETEMISFFADQLKKSTGITELTKNFVALKAPTESNYRQTLSWNADNATVSGLTGSLTATQNPIPTVTATVINGDGSSEDVTTNYKELFYKDGKLISPVQRDYYHFVRWDIFSANTNELVAQSFSVEFNYIGYEDYIVQAVYADNTNGEIVQELSSSDRQALINSTPTNTASIVSLTRNHWGQYDNGAKMDGVEEKDRLYVDFVLNYSHNGKLVSSDSDITQIGFMLYKGTPGSGTLAATVDLTSKRNQISNKNRYEYGYGIANTQNNANLVLYIVPYYVLNNTTTVHGEPSATFSFKDIAKSNTTWGSPEYFGQVITGS